MKLDVVEEVLVRHLLIKGYDLMDWPIRKHVLKLLYEFSHEKPLVVQMVRLDPDFRIVFRYEDGDNRAIMIHEAHIPVFLARIIALL